MLRLALGAQAVAIEKEFAGEGGPSGEGGLNLAALGFGQEDVGKVGPYFWHFGQLKQ